MGVDSRGQSQVLGTILLVGVVVVLGTVLTVAAFAFLEGGETTTPASVDASATAENVTLVHQAGRPLAIEDTSVVLRQSGEDRRLPLSDFEILAGDTDGEMVAGETLSIAHDGIPGEMTVLVVDEAANQVVSRATVLVSPRAIPVVRFDQTTIDSFESSQDVDGDYTVTDGGRTLRLTNNTWKRIDYDYTINSSTVLSVEFKSTSEGEIHGIGLEDDNGQSSGRIFRVFGTQNWGVDDFDTYRAGDGWVRYEIPVGEYYTGDARYLVFVNDDDTDASGTSWFRDVRVYQNATG